MKRQLAITFVLLFVACNTALNQTPYQLAAKAYYDVGQEYKAARKSVVAARANHLLTDAQWNQYHNLQVQIAAADPKVSGLLKTWKATGSKPLDFDTSLALFQSLVVTVQNISTGGK